MEVIGWPVNVNQKILNETTITQGEGGKVEDSTSNGFKETRATSLATPAKFNVKMDFDWGGAGSEFQYPVDSKGLTEYDRFIRWWKFEHQKGAKPFWFPSITKQSIDVLDSSQTAGMALYKITGNLSESQSGYSQSITMTWEEVYSGIITIPDSVKVTLKSASGHNGKCKCVLSGIPDTTPRFDEVSLTIDGVATTILTLQCVNDRLSITYNAITTTGTHVVKITYNSSTVSYSVYL